MATVQEEKKDGSAIVAVNEEKQSATDATVKSGSENVDADDIVMLDENDEPEQELTDFTLPKPTSLPPKEVLDPVQGFVASAVMDQEKLPTGAPPTQTYRALVDAVRLQKDVEILCHICLALRTCGHGNTLHLITTPKHARLVHHIVRLDPFSNAAKAPHTDATAVAKQTKLRYALADAHFQLLMALVSAKTVFVVPILTALWKMLTWKRESCPFEELRRIHAALATVMQLCPKARTELFPIMAARCPHRNHPQAQLVWYYRQCFQVLKYLPIIQNQVLRLLIDKCLEIDVEIEVSDDGHATIYQEEDNDNEMKDDAVFQYDGEDAKQQTTKNVEAEKTVDEMASKLDALLYLFFQFVQTRPSVQEVYPTLMEAFSNSILITHKSKFVQFVVFHACGLDRPQLVEQDEEDDEPLYREFAAQLINMVVDPYLATGTRQTAACYLASFVSRGAFVNAETACETVSALLRWAEVYMKALGNSWEIRASDSRQQGVFHILFYTVSQAAFYIMCFRGKEAMEYYQEQKAQEGGDDDEGSLSLIDVGSERWTRLCGHALRPLNYCLESVKHEFLQRANLLGWIDEAVLDQLCSNNTPTQIATTTTTKPTLGSTPRRRRIRPTAIRTPATLERERKKGGVGGLGRGRNPLDSFFPFDPYLLRQSHVFIEPFYHHWNDDVAEGDNDGDDIEAEEITASSSDGEDEDGEEQVADMAESHQSSSPPEAKSKEEMKEAWTKTLTRSRAPSIENGSW